MTRCGRRSGWRELGLAVGLVTLAAAAAGCGHHGAVQRAAAAELGCPAEQVEVEDAEADDAYLAVGCGEKALCRCGSEGCQSFGEIVRARAARYFECRLERVHVEQRDWRGVYIARGCRFEAKYLCGLTGCYREGQAD